MKNLPSRSDSQSAPSRRMSAYYGAFSLLIIPLYTISFATSESLIHSNMSLIGGKPGKYWGLLLWGVMCSLFFANFLSYLFSLTQYDNQNTRTLLHIACTLLVCTVLLPFVPDKLPVIATFHNIFAMSASLLVLFVVLRFIQHMAGWSQAIYRRSMRFMCCAVAVFALLLLTTGISGLLEVVVVISVCYLLFTMMHSIHRTEGGAPEAIHEGKAKTQDA